MTTNEALRNALHQANETLKVYLGIIPDARVAIEVQQYDILLSASPQISREAVLEEAAQLAEEWAHRYAKQPPPEPVLWNFAEALRALKSAADGRACESARYVRPSSLSSAHAPRGSAYDHE